MSSIPLKPSTAGFVSSASNPATVVPTTPYSQLSIGIPKETYPNERRVAVTPQNVALLLKKGFKSVLVEKGAGAQADFLDEAYAAAGATLVDDASAVWSQADIVLKVRGPSAAEAEKARVEAEAKARAKAEAEARAKAKAEAEAKKRAAQAERKLLVGTTRASYFWDDGSGRQGDTGMPASGKPMQKGLFASPSWPLGTEGYVIYKGRKAKFFIGDRGPGVPSSHGVMLDIDGKTFAELTGGTWNPNTLTVQGNGGLGHINVTYVITKWGDGPGRRGKPVPFATGAYRE